MIDPKRELFKWGPIDGRVIYVDSFGVGFEEYPEYIGASWPDVIGYIKEDKVRYVVDYGHLRDAGEQLFRDYVLVDDKLKEHYVLWVKTTEVMKVFEASVKNLKDLSDQELAQKYKEWIDCILDFWLKGFLPELSNWGGERVLKNMILEFNKIDFINIFEALAAPEDLSFFQKEELELMKIKLMDEQENALKEHQNRYYWLRNNYAFTKVLGIDFFKEELNNITKTEAEAKIKEINEYVDKIKQKKIETIQKYNVPDDVVKVAEKLAYCVWWQDYRKSFIFISNHIKSMFVSEISKRKDIPFKNLCYYTTYELKDLLEEDKRIENVKERFNGFLTYYDKGGKINYYTGDEATKIIEPYIETNIDPNLKEFKGMVVSKGKESIYKGTARILLNPDASKISEGEILVAPMTSPDFIVAMRKAGAIITDEGGMTCHAAIVSRELGIPCIVATRIATKVLKDGQNVEVDAEKGIVRIIP